MAGSKVGSAWYDLRADEKGLQGDLKRATGTITKAGDTAGKGFASKFGAGLSGIKSSISSIFPLVGALGAAFVATKIISFFGDAISAASDLGETVNKVGVIFGQEALPGLEKWAEGAAAAMGQSKQQALDAAATFATFGKSAGLAGEDLVGFSTELVELSSDLASFHNAEPQEVIDALGAALRGEAEPMRRFGVLLDDATLRSKAFEMGIISSTKNALTPQQKVLAAQAVILEQTGDAQGDFARTSDGLANQQRILAAELTNVTAEIGEMLLPIMVELAHFAVNTLIPALSGMVSYFKVSGERIGEFADGVGDFVDRTSIRMGELGATIEARANEIGVDVGDMKNLVIHNMTEFGQSFETAKLNAERSLLGLPPVMSDAVNATVAAWKERDLSGTIAADVAAGAPVIDAGVEAGITEPTKEELEATRLAAENAARAMSADYAATIASGADNVSQAWDALLQGAETQMSETARIADINAKLTSPALRNALRSEDPYLKAQAVSTKATLLNELALLTTGAITHAVRTGQSLPDALNNRREAARVAAAQTRLATIREFDLGALPASVAGTRMGANLGVGIGSQYYNVQSKAAGVSSGARAALNNQSGVAAGGAAIGTAWMGGLTSAIWNRMYQLSAATAYARQFMGGSLPERGPLKGKVAEMGGRAVGASWVGGVAAELAKASSVIGNPLGRLGLHAPVRFNPSGLAGAVGGNTTGPTTHMGGIVINVNGYNQDPVELSRVIANTIRLRARAVI